MLNAVADGMAPRVGAPGTVNGSPPQNDEHNGGLTGPLIVSVNETAGPILMHVSPGRRHV